MKRVLTLILAAMMILSLFAGCGDKEGAGSSSGDKLADVKFDAFAVGYGKADITPDYTTQIGIVGNNDHATRLSTGVLEPIMATCIAFTDTDGTTVLVYGTDLHGTNADVIAEIRKQLTEKTGVPGDHIQFNCTHNHCGPLQQMNSAVGPIQIYMEMMIKNCVQAGVDALESRKPAKMYTTFTRPEDMVFVRHYLRTDGEYEGTSYDNIAKTGGEFLGFAEKGDNLLQMVKFVREGEKDVIMFNWQGHPFSSSSEYYTYLSGVSPAIARRFLLEKADTESVYIMGGSGDSVQQSARSAARKFKDNVAYGEALADAMIAAFDSFQEAETGKIYYTYNDQYSPPGHTTPTKYVLSAFGFGDLGYISAPSEMFQTNAISVRDGSPWKYTFYAQLSNGTGEAYVPDAMTWQYKNGAYERGPCKVSAGDGEAFAEEQLKMLNDIFTQSGQSVKDKDEGYITVEERKTDGQTYTNPNVGGKPTKGPYDFYFVDLVLGVSQVRLLVKDEATANKIMGLKTMKLYTNYSNVVVDAE